MSNFSLSSVHTEFSESSDDELDETPPEFYDPDKDDRDEAWVVRQRKGRDSDAILSCPACFTTLCIDCQRHEKYVTQYRAMFVLNCKILDSQKRQFPVHSKKRKQSSCKISEAQSRQESTSEPYVSNDEIYRPVCCSVCETEVAVIDKDEMYHFYNIMPSYA